ncbi:phage tail tape measure protein [Pseudomonas fluorescens]|uniref:phage tail tape measure protein n=1 Tax=Pseudomonas fluorescens TaxID=294 RepID=UPI000F47F816|nr:phage tail tape measure protein [Pseudomonas fluorescens]RON88431.1 phage tail tape measure protein [Pseudomonas fluorescens]
MTSIAELGIKVDSTDAAQASSDLDKLTDSGKKSEEAAKKTGRAWEQALTGMAADTQQIVRELQALNAKQDATAQMMATVGRSISGASSAFISAAASIDRYRANNEALNASQNKTAESAEKAGRAVKSEADQLAALIGKIDPTVAALGRLDEMEKKLNGYKSKGLLDADSFNEYQAKIDQSRANLTRFDDSLTRTGNTAKQTAAALRGVPAQFTDIVVSLQGGQAPLTVLLQQGGQLKDMFGGIGPAAKALGGYVLGLINPFTVAAAAVGALTLAYYKGSQEADEYNKAIIFTGNSAGTSATQLASMAEQVSATIGTTGAAAEVLAKLAGNGKIASGSFEEITEAALQMEKATGKAIDETIAEFAKIAKDPVAAAKELNDQYNFLTASVYSQIVALKDQGDTIGATKLLTDTYANTIQERTGQVTQNLGLIESAWNKIKAAASGALDAAKDIGRIQTLEQQAEVIRQRLQTNQGRGGRAAALGLETRDTAKDRGDLAFLELQIDAERERTKWVGEARRENDLSVNSQAALNAQLAATESNAKKLKNRLEEINKLARDAKGGTGGRVYTEAELEQLREAARKQFADKKTPAGAVNLTEFNDSKNQLSLILGEYKNAQKELEAAQKAGLVTQEDYLLKRQALIGNERDEVTAAYQAEISSLEAAKGKASTSAAQRIQLDQKIADARANMVKAQKEADSELEVIATNEQGRLAKQAQAIKVYTDALDQQNVALRLAGGRAADGVGRGDRENAINGELNGIADRANQQRLDLARDRADKARNMSAEEYQAKLDAINRSEKDLNETVLSNYEQMSAAQSDWRNGATSAFSNYLESARNIAGQTRDLFTNAFSSMEDAVVNFAITGKGSFSDFTKSILADMARIATRQASSALLSSLVGAATSYFTGGGGGNGLAAGSAGATSSNLGASSAGYSSSYFPQALGGAWSSGVQMFANGGAFTNNIVSTPTAFGMAGGRAGVMGEAGPEAIMPLTRTAGGQLGVRAISGGGSGGGNVYNFPVAVSVQTQGSGGAASTEDTTQLGKGIQQAAKAEAETAIARALQPGGSIWRLTNGRG